MLIPIVSDWGYSCFSDWVYSLVFQTGFISCCFSLGLFLLFQIGFSCCFRLDLFRVVSDSVDLQALDFRLTGDDHFVFPGRTDTFKHFPDEDLNFTLRAAITINGKDKFIFSYSRKEKEKQVWIYVAPPSNFYHAHTKYDAKVMFLHLVDKVGNKIPPPFHRT